MSDDAEDLIKKVEDDPTSVIRDAARQYRNASSAKGRQEALVLQLCAMKIFLADNGIEFDDLAPITALASSLLDATVGAKSDLLSIATVGGRPSEEFTSRAELKAAALAARDLLMILGVPERDANRQVGSIVEMTPTAVKNLVKVKSLRQNHVFTLFKGTTDGDTPEQVLDHLRHAYAQHPRKNSK